jgi:hypothetical protein
MVAVSARLRELVPERQEEGLLPVLPALSGLFPGDGLRRGCIVAVQGSPGWPGDPCAAPGPALLCTALAAGVSAAGAWCAAVGMPQLGTLAAAEAGVDVDRLLLVPDPGPRWPQAVAALLDGCDLVLLRPGALPSAQAARRLAAHVRRSRSALVVTTTSSGWAGAHARLWAAYPRWVGIGAGHGRLRGRRVQVFASGRGGTPARARWCWLPSPNGCAAVAEPGGADISKEASRAMAKTRIPASWSQPGTPAHQPAWLAREAASGQE